MPALAYLGGALHFSEEAGNRVDKIESSCGVLEVFLGFCGAGSGIGIFFGWGVVVMGL